MWEKIKGEAEIIEIRISQDLKLVKLSENIFRPNMGGQDSDTGWIIKGDKKIPVLGAKTIDNEIYIVIPSNALLKEGDRVKIEINLNRRKKLSRLHTAQHILFKALQTVCGELEFKNVFLTIKNDRPHGELVIRASKEISSDTITKAELLANKVILENRPVLIYEISPKELDNSVRIRYTLLEKVRKIRIVEIKEFDKTACSGTHVDFTGEIGLVKVLDWKKINSRNTYKINFTVGDDALEYTFSMTNMVLETSKNFSFQPHQIRAFLSNLVEKNRLLDGIKDLLFDLLHIVVDNNILTNKPIIICHPNLPIKESLRFLKKLRRKHKKNLPTVILVSNINNMTNIAILLSVGEEKSLIEKLEDRGFKCWGREILHCTNSASLSPKNLEDILQEVLGNEINKLLDCQGKRRS